MSKHFVVTCCDREDDDGMQFPIVGVFDSIKAATKFCKKFKKPSWFRGKFVKKLDLHIEAWTDGTSIEDYSHKGVPQGKL